MLPWYMRYRWLFICTLVLPFNAVWQLVQWCLRKRVQVITRQRHELDVDTVRQVVKQAVIRQRFPLVTDRPWWKAMALRSNKYKTHATQVPVSHMNRIIFSDDFQITHRLAVEPFVTMRMLTEYLLPFNLSLPVVPELDDLTVGGLLMGVGIESSSHNYGLFSDNVVEVEIVLPSGNVVVCSRENRKDIFECLPWSYGTLGIATLIVLRLVPVQPLVRLHYEPFCSLSEFQHALNEACENKDFVEGLVFSDKDQILIYGTMVKHSNIINDLNKWYQPWFYKHAYQMKGNWEVVPLAAYYHRHTKSIFWQMAELIPFANQMWFRYLFGWLFPLPIDVLKRVTPASISKVYQDRFVFQDLLLPLSRTAASIREMMKLTKITPIWVCPFVRSTAAAFIRGRLEYFVDIGLYGMLPSRSRAGRVVPACEKYVRKNHGFQMLYADVYQNETEFRQMFHHAQYDSVKRELDPQNIFPTIYDKVKFVSF